MMREAEIGLRIVIADVPDQMVQELVVVREFAILDILTDDVAKNTAEILVTREGEKRAGVG